jgi:hypothetical protein
METSKNSWIPNQRQNVIDMATKYPTQVTNAIDCAYLAGVAAGRKNERELVVREIGEKVRELRVFRDPADIAKGYEMSDTASCYNQGVNDSLEIINSFTKETK